MSNELRVLFVVSNLIRAGAEMQSITLINGLNKKNFKCMVVCLTDLEDLLPELNTNQIKYVRLEKAFKFDISIVFRLAKIIDEEQIQVIHATEQYAMLLSWLALTITKHDAPIVAALHTLLSSKWKQGILDRFLYGRILQRIKTVIYVCDAQRSIWTDSFPKLKENAVVVHNGVDTSHFRPGLTHTAASPNSSETRQSQTDFRELVVACIAGFRKEKGHDLLIRAFSETPENCTLLLAGEGSLREDIERQTKLLGLENRVTFLGMVEDVRAVLCKADLTVLPSTTETFSLSMLESMAMGIPVIASNIGGMHEAIDHNWNGLLYPASNTDTLARILAELSKDRARIERLGANARQTVVEKFQVELMIKKISSHLSHAARNHHLVK